jgi:hypothetical protein
MSLDVRSVMLVGVLLSALTVLLFTHVGRAFPAERKRHLRLWTVGLLMQPLAWGLLAARGWLPDAASIVLGNGLLLLGFGEMLRAVRGFQGRPERAGLVWGGVLGAMVLLAVFSALWPHYSARVLVNSTCAAALMGGIAWVLRPAFRRGGFSAARLVGLFSRPGASASTRWRRAQTAACSRPAPATWPCSSMPASASPSSAWASC